MIEYTNIVRVRREVENILLLMEELENRGLCKEAIVNIILNESTKSSKKDECPCKNKHH